MHHLRHLPPIVRLGVAMSCTAGTSGIRTSGTLGASCPCAASSRLTRCEGVGDVVGVVTPLGGVAQVSFHGVKVVEVGVVLRVHQDRGVEEDGEDRSRKGRKARSRRDAHA